MLGEIYILSFLSERANVEPALDHFKFPWFAFLIFSQEAYSMLNKFEVAVVREEVERVDTLRYSFEKLLAQSVSMITTICSTRHPNSHNIWGREQVRK